MINPEIEFIKDTLTHSLRIIRPSIAEKGGGGLQGEYLFSIDKGFHFLY